MSVWGVISMFLVVMAGLVEGRTITVDCNGPSDFNDIQAAINDANDDDVVIVADGIYTGAGNRDINFNGLAITVKSENGPENCIIDCNGTEAEPHRGFRFDSGEDANSVLDGFTITNGYAEDGGGGVYCSSSSPTISSCILTGNFAGFGGGGMVIAYRDSDPTLTNCTFSGNSAGACGGAILLVDGCKTTLINCILWGDNAPYDSEFATCDLDWTSHLFVRFSNVQGGYVWQKVTWGPGSIDTDPCFVDAANNDYHLKSQAGRWEPVSKSWVADAVTSPCIDAGNPGCPLGDEPDPNGNRINMGAYGGTAQASKSPANWALLADLTNDRKVDFNDLKVFVDYWLETGECIPSDLNRDRYVNGCDFAIFINNWLW